MVRALAAPRRRREPAPAAGPASSPPKSDSCAAAPSGAAIGSEGSAAAGPRSSVARRISGTPQRPSGVETRRWSTSAAATRSPTPSMSSAARDGRAAGGAAVRHRELALRAGALLLEDGGDGGDDLAGLLDEDVVADADVLAADVVLVVERRAGDRRAAEPHGAQLGDGREDAGAADLHRDRLDDGLGALRRVLVGARPARRLGRRAERLVERAVVDLHDGAVHLERERVAERLQLVDRAQDLVEPAAAPRARLRGEPERGEALQERVLRGGVRLAAQRAEAVEHDRERAPRDLARVEELDRAGGGVARVLEGLLAARGLLLGEREEAGLGHVDLAARLEALGLAGDAERERADRADVGGDIVARLAVPARGGDGELAPLVDRAEREAVDLRLDDVVHRVEADDRAHHRVEVGEVRAVVGVLERLHRDGVGELLEALGGRAADAPRGGVRVSQVGAGRLDRGELAHHRVELGVGDLGRGVAVVEHRVALELAAEPRGALGDRVGGVRGGLSGGRPGGGEEVVLHGGDDTRPRHAAQTGSSAESRCRRRARGCGAPCSRGCRR